MAERLDDQQVEDGLAGLDGGWSRTGDLLVCESQHADFGAALDRLNAIAALAEQADHHPDLELHSWNRLRVRLTTHSAGGITGADLRLAQAIDALT